MARQEVWATDWTVLQRRTHPALIRYTQPPRSTTPSAKTPSPTPTTRACSHWQAPLSHMLSHALRVPGRKDGTPTHAPVPLRMQLPASTTFARSLQPTPDARDPSSRSLQTVRGLHPKVPTRIHLPEHLARRRPPLKAPPQPARISGPQGLLPNPTTLSAAVPLNHPHNSSVFPLAGAALAHFLPRAQRAKRRMTIEWLMGSTVDPSAMTITCRS